MSEDVIAPLPWEARAKSNLADALITLDSLMESIRSNEGGLLNVSDLADVKTLINDAIRNLDIATLEKEGKEVDMSPQEKPALNSIE